MKLSTRLFLALSVAPLIFAQTQFSSDVLALSPLGYWPLSANTNDASTHGNNGSQPNGLAFSNIFNPPVEAQAAVFDRSRSQFVLLSAQGSVGFNLGSFHAFSAMAWIRTLGLHHMTILAKTDQTAGWTMSVNSGAGHFGLILGAGGNIGLGIESAVGVNDGAWHLVAATYDGSGKASGVKFYVDGVAVAAAAGSIDALGNGSILNSGPLAIGSASDGSDSFEGEINDVAVFGTVLTPAQIQQLAGDTAISKAVLGQFAFGGGWYSAVYFSNTGSNSVSFPVTFTGDNGTPLAIPSIGSANKTVTLAPGGSTVIEALNDLSELRQGYVSVTLPPGVTGYGVFRQSVAKVADQEAVAPLSPVTSSNIPMIYDETSYITGVALVNPSAVAVTVTVAASDFNGNLIGTSSVSLPAFNKTAIALRTLPALSQIVGTRGTVRFSVSSGNIAVLGLRFFGTAFTSIPAAAQNSKLVGAN